SEKTMCSPMPDPICLVENVDGSLCVNAGAVEHLSKYNQPVVVVSVVGLYRTGKSYLLNRLAGKQTGFALGSTIESKTKGIWMWCVPHPHNTGQTLVLLDTEGLGDVDKGDSKNDAWIFCLAVLLSSTLVYNSRGTIDNTAVEKLHYVTELAEQIKIKSPASRAAEEEEEEEEEEADSQFVQFFPKFIWAVRDFSLELELEERGRVTEDEYLDFALKLKKGLGIKNTNYNLPRQCIRQYFPTRKCFVFPFPASQEKMVCLENLDESEIFPKFLNATQQFCDYIFAESKVKTLKGGYRVTGRIFGHLVRTYVETISSGKVPCLENAVVVMAQIENQAALQEGLKVYQSGMEQVRSLFPVNLSELSAEHQKMSNMANTEFMKCSFKDEGQEYFKKLLGAVDKHYAELIAQNREASDKKCQQILSDLYEKINERVQRGEYAKPGGYHLYCTHRDDAIIQYNIHPSKGIQADMVLERFLSEKSVEAKLILQTDEQLTESEKKIREYLSNNNQPVVVVSVVGLYRTGKSYLMNRLAGKQTVAGFALGSTIESKTKGIWMWCVPHPLNAKQTLVLLDTEGLGDVDKGDSKNDAWIFCLAVLLSSTLVYNSRGTIDNTAVEKLHYVTELAEQIKIKSPASRAAEEEEEEDCNFVQFFPNFIWTVRDFSLELEIEKRGRVTEDEYLEFALQLKKGLSIKNTNYNLPRQCIRNYFPTRKCFVFPFPAPEDKMVCLETLDEGEISPKFLNVTKQFCDHIFAASKVKTLKGGYRVTGRIFGHLVQSYVETISSGKVPCLENAVVVMAQIENQKAFQEGLKVYQNGMEQVKSLFPVKVSELSAEHQKMSNMASTEFMKHSFKDEGQEYFKKLVEAVDQHYAELIVQNMEASDKKCQQILSDLYEKMNERVQRGEYAKPGGYNLYCTHRQDVITQYNSQPNKGIQADLVLERFLSEKSVEAKLILQTDEQLTESEKKVQ
ncbi:guanylate-binding protein 1-like, partial [Clarias magur]